MTPLSDRNSGAVLVRVSPEILEHMKTGDVEPVVILGVEDAGDGTYDMTLMTTDLIYENRKLRESIAEARGGADRQQRSLDVLAAVGTLEHTGIRRDDEALLVKLNGFELWVAADGSLEPDVDGLL